MPRVLITGVAGFIGSHVADHCLAEGFEVVGVDDLSGGFEENVPAGVAFRRGSVTDAAFIGRVFEGRRFDYVYHLAAYAAEGLSHFIRRYNYENNVVGSMTLVNEAIKHESACFVFTSSIAVYGANQLPMHENLTPRPEDPYGIGKYAVELDLAAAHHVFGLPYVIFRPHNVYGERQNIADKYRNVVGIFLNQVLQGRPMTCFGDGLQTRAFSHIDNVAGLIARAPLVPGAAQQVINVGADEPHTILTLAQEVARAVGVPAVIEHLPARDEVVHAFADHSRALAIFGEQPHVTLRDGIGRMAAWVKTHGPRQPVAFKNIEVRAKLPPSWRS
ncbi:MAG: UDP-glucose 4-epimerase [Gemmatimonas sp.]|nr:UDP-glucose 4-epimerase [Gemmatimonas sp.]